MKYGIAVKAFIVNDKEELLILKRDPNDVYKPGKWDNPGGKLEKDEDLIAGLKRETKEETNLDIEIILPLNVKTIKINEEMIVSLIIFLCKPKSEKIILSEEHTEYKWVSIKDKKEIGKLEEYLIEDIQKYKELKKRV